MCQSIFLAVVVAPIMWICAATLLGWNEKRAVCNWKAIGQGDKIAVDVGCNKTESDGELVFFGCDIVTDKLDEMSFANSDFRDFKVKTTGLSIKSEMLQCVEQRSTSKNSVGGGTTTTKTYSTEWRGSRVDDQNFDKGSNWQTNCGYNNPHWDSGVPKSGAIYAETAFVGAYTLTKSFVEQIELSFSPVPENIPGWSVSGSQLIKASNAHNFFGSNPGEKIGAYRVSFKSLDLSKPMVTVLGENDGGAVVNWVSKDSFMCSGYTLGNVMMGNLDKDTFFERLREASEMKTVILRIVGFILFWIGFSLCFAPLEVAADFIPFVGPYIGDAIGYVTCCIACVPATGCCILIVSIAWVFMRPMVGIPLFLGSVLILGFVMYSRSKVKGGRASGEGEHEA